MSLVQRRPGRLLRALFRAPLVLYRAHLGWVFGHRLVYLAHVGRKTGLRRETVVEVVHHDRATSEVFLVAAWGERCDWYRNLEAAPPLEVRFGARRWTAVQRRFPDTDETFRVLRDYHARHPVLWPRLAARFGLPADPTDPAVTDTDWTFRMIALRPAHLP